MQSEVSQQHEKQLKIDRVVRSRGYLSNVKCCRYIQQQSSSSSSSITIVRTAVASCIPGNRSSPVGRLDESSILLVPQRPPSEPHIDGFAYIYSSCPNHVLGFLLMFDISFPCTSFSFDHYRAPPPAFSHSSASCSYCCTININSNISRLCTSQPSPHHCCDVGFIVCTLSFVRAAVVELVLVPTAVVVYGGRQARRLVGFPPAVIAVGSYQVRTRYRSLNANIKTVWTSHVYPNGPCISVQSGVVQQIPGTSTWRIVYLSRFSPISISR